MKRFFVCIAPVFVAIVSSPSSLSAAGQESAIQIEKAWARASIIASRPAAAYLTIVNQGSKPDLLISVSSPVAKTVSIHLSETTNGISQMSPVHELPIHPRAKVTFNPSGLHLMLMNLRGPLKKGEVLPLTLNFQTAGRINIDALILDPGAKEPE